MTNRQEIAENSPNTGGALIAADNIAVAYQGLTAISGVSLSVKKGEIVTLIGPNGAGKSTIIRALLGLVPLQTGAIAKQAGLKVGYAPQTLSLDAAMPITVKRFLTLSPTASKASINKALEKTAAENLVDKQLTSLSGGQLRRVLLARAFMGSPDLLVLDEPVAGVDAQGQSDLYALIGKVAKETGCGVLIVSHDLHLVMAQTDHVICINGHICCEGHPTMVTKDPAYKTLFTPMATSQHHHHDDTGELAPYEHNHDHHHH